MNYTELKPVWRGRGEIMKVIPCTDYYSEYHPRQKTIEAKEKREGTIYYYIYIKCFEKSI